MREPPSRVLAVYAHPGDADVACGGTLASWALAGSTVETVVCTSGDKGTADVDVKPAELVERRAKETAAAASTLGVARHHHLGYPDGDLENCGELRARLVELIRDVRPAVVLCPDPTAVFFGEEYFNHRDHRVVGISTLDSLSPAAALPHYFPESGPAWQVETVLMSGTLEPSIWVDVTRTIDIKVDAVACNRSQLNGDGESELEALRLRASEEGRRAGVAHAEGFRRLRLGG